jgi:hypothetical protein
MSFLPFFSLFAIGKDHGSQLDLHFVNTEKMEMYGGWQRQQSRFRFL